MSLVFDNLKLELRLDLPCALPLGLEPLSSVSGVDWDTALWRRETALAGDARGLLGISTGDDTRPLVLLTDVSGGRLVRVGGLVELLSDLVLRCLA